MELEMDFELSPEGYSAAIAWLRANDHGCTLNHEIPMDCYTVVTEANRVKNSMRHSMMPEPVLP
ncbi:hypothetical protein D3C87_1858360 [compost metagenome]